MDDSPSSSSQEEVIPTPFTSVQITLPSTNAIPQQLTPLQRRLKDFTPPSGYEIDKSPKKSQKRSIIYDYGIRVKGVDQQKGKKNWHCLASDSCKEVIKIKHNTSNASDHLQAVHHITSRRSLLVQKARAVNGTKVTKERLAILQMDALRYHHLNVAKFIISSMLPFSFPESAQFRLFVKMLDRGNEFDTPLHLKSVKKLILELYLSTTATLKTEIADVKGNSSLPMFHLNLDLWTSRISSEKYVGVRVFFINRNWEFKSHLLAVRLFRPSPTISEERMSDVLKLWCDKVLSEFGINSQDLYSSTSDSGSDVKRLCCKLLTARWDWCISHLCNCALVESFGTSLQAHRSKNIAFRELLKKVKSVIEHLHKSAKMRRKFEDLQFVESGKRLKLIKDMPHRWLGTIRLLERFLLLWQTLRSHYYKTEESTFPVDEDHKVLVECFSLMKPVGDVITIAQASDHPSAIDSFMALCRLRKSVLEPSTPLPIYDPSAEDYSAHRPNCMRHTVALSPLTVETRQLLYRALETRFFNGYNGTPRSSTLEMQVFLHPAYRSLRCLDCIMDPTAATTRKTEVISEVVQLAYGVAQAKLQDGGVVSTEEEAQDSEPPSKIPRISDSAPITGNATGAQGLLSFSEFEDPGCNSDVYASKTLLETVEEEVAKYLQEERIPASEVPSRKLLKWWKGMGMRYPNLSAVAQCVLSHPASSAAVERDFGSAGNLITGSRSRLDSAFVDMTLFLNANFSMIPARIKKVESSTGSWLDFVPTRYNGEEYVPFEGTEEPAALYESDGESDADCGLFE